MSRIARTLLSAASLALPACALAALPGNLPEPPAQVKGIPVALLVDAGSGQRLFARRPDQRFMPASMAKAMTAYVAFELIAAGKLAAEQRFEVSRQTAARWNGRGTSMYLGAGESVSVDDLLRGIAIASANDASVVLAEGVAGSVPAWTAMMNAKARQLGMVDSHFATPNGWPDGGRTYVSAQDLAVLGEALIERHPELYRRYFGQKRMTWKGATLQSRDPTAGVVQGADGIKTGHTREAGFNFLGSALRGERRLVMVVAGARTEAQRAAASRALLDWGFAAWRSRLLFPPGEEVATARVQGGTARSVGLVAPRPVTFATFSSDDRLSARLVYDGPLQAPLARGAQVARLEIAAASGLTASVPLVTAEAVGAAGPMDRLVNGLVGLFS